MGIKTSTRIRKTSWTALTRAQVAALFRRLGVERDDARLTLRCAETGACPHMVTYTVRPEDGSRAFYLRVTNQGAGEYDVALKWEGAKYDVQLIQEGSETPATETPATVEAPHVHTDGPAIPVVTPTGVLVDIDATSPVTCTLCGASAEFAALPLLERIVVAQTTTSGFDGPLAPVMAIRALQSYGVGTREIQCMFDTVRADPWCPVTTCIPQNRAHLSVALHYAGEDAYAGQTYMVTAVECSTPDLPHRKCTGCARLI